MKNAPGGPQRSKRPKDTDDPAGSARHDGENGRLANLFLRLATRELETPVSHLKSKLLALAEEADPWRLREEIEALTESVYRLHRLVETLADSASIEAGNVELETTEINLSRLFSERISKRLRRLRGFRVLPELPPTLEIRGDRRHFTFLLDDLLDAAIHMTPTGGIIHAGLAQEKGEIAISTHNRGARLPPGRFDSFLEWIVEDVKHTSGLGGIGIGLYRTHRTAEMLGGRLELLSPPEGGASFIVRFPVGS